MSYCGGTRAPLILTPSLLKITVQAPNHFGLETVFVPKTATTAVRVLYIVLQRPVNA